MFQTCKKCLQEKLYIDFHINKTYSSGYASKCKECAIKASTIWAKNNPEKRKRIFDDFKNRNPEYSKKYYNKERSKIYSAKWRAANPEKHKETVRKRFLADPKKFSRSKLEWDKRNPGYRNSITAKRRAKKLQATPVWANVDDIKSIYDLARLLTEITGIPYAVDHIVPLQSKLVCGLHVAWNLNVIPKSENISKSNRYWPDMP